MGIRNLCYVCSNGRRIYNCILDNKHFLEIIQSIRNYIHPELKQGKFNLRNFFPKTGLLQFGAQKDFRYTLYRYNYIFNFVSSNIDMKIELSIKFNLSYEDFISPAFLLYFFLTQRNLSNEIFEFIIQKYNNGVIR